MALSLLKGNDADVVLAAATDDPYGLAECLSAQQPFKVHVFATFPDLGSALTALQQSLKTIHISSGWFAAAPLEVARAICDAITKPNEPDSDQDGGPQDGPMDTNDAVSASSEDSFDPAWHQLLQPCPREHAEKVTVIRQALKARLGSWQAAAVLSNYRESSLRVPGKGCQRYIVDCRGSTMRLAIEDECQQASVAA